MRRSVLIAVLLMTLALPARAQSPALRKTWRPKQGGITCVCFRADGKQLAIGTRSGMMKIKQVATDDDEGGPSALSNTAGWLQYGPIVYTTHSAAARTGSGSLVTLSPGGTFHVFYTDTYENQTSAPIGTLEGHSMPFGTLSGNGRYLALTKGGPDLWIGRPAEWERHGWWDQETDWRTVVMRRPEGVNGNIVSLSLNRDGSLLAAAYHTGDGKGALVVFNRKTGRTLKVKHVDFAPTAVAYGPKGDMLAAVGKGLVWLGDPKGEHGKVLPAPSAPVASVAFSPKERWLAAACTDGRIYLWDTVAHRGRLAWKAHEGTVHALAWAPGARALASGGDDGAVKLWDLPAEIED